jgi:phosphopantetheine--protein transferase-like protein
MIFVGNDVVDLEEPRTQGRASDDRFVERVFDADERAAIRSSTDADLELWTRWAAKEAGFKVISKLIGAPPPFVHRAFKVEWTKSEDASGSGDRTPVRQGRVTHADHEARVSVVLCQSSVHAVGFGAVGGPPEQAILHPRVSLLDSPHSPWSGALDALEGRFTDRERDAVYSRQSAAVRLGARADLARVLGVAEERLEIVCDPGRTSQRPPRVLLDGGRTGADVSLSHDGRWIAWVLWINDNAEEG